MSRFDAGATVNGFQHGTYAVALADLSEEQRKEEQLGVIMVCVMIFLWHNVTV